MGGLLSTGPTLSSFAIIHCLISPICIFFNNKKQFQGKSDIAQAAKNYVTKKGMDYFQFHLYFNTYNEFLNTYRLQVATLLKCRIKATIQYNTKLEMVYRYISWLNRGKKNYSAK